jgi:5-formyltetrahydrofolate cyclo-ligase
MSSDPEIRRWRKRERERLVALRLAASPDERRQWSLAIESRLAPLLRSLPGAVIGLYWPIKGEFDPLPLAGDLAAGGRSVALPAVVDRHQPLEYRAWQQGAEMESGMHGIPAPRHRVVLRPDIVLVPLVGFDEANYRLGYGGGYFDRTIAHLAPQPVTIGVGFETARLPTILPQPHDLALDFVITEKRLRARPSP